MLLQQALQRSPEFIELAARDEEARSYVAAGRSWIAGRPSLEVSYLDDQPRSDLGMTELEYGVQIPLWRFGEKRHAAQLGERFSTQATAWKDYLRLTMAGRLRDALADLDAAEQLLTLEHEATQEARRLVETVEKLFSSGELAQLDVMQAKALLLQQQRVELDAANTLSNAESTYALLTGLSARPATAHQEISVNSPDVPASHPWLRFLDAEIEVADAAVQQTRLEAKGSPALTVGSRRQRDNRTEAYHDSMVVALNLPFGGSSHVNARVSSARRVKVDAEVQRHTAHRELTQQLQQSRRELDAVIIALEMSSEQIALDQTQATMARAAFEVGEITLFQVLTTFQQIRANARAHETLKLKKERLVMQFNQLSGVLP